MRFKGLLHVVAAGIICLTFPGALKAQGCLVRDLMFSPPDPRPRQKLALEISVTSSSVAQLTITLSVQIDLNKNFRIEPDQGEIVKRNLTVKDNDENDHDAAKNAFRVEVYDVPENNPPFKYSAVAQCGTDRKSTSIKIPVQNTASDCAPASPLRGLLATYCSSLGFSLSDIFNKRGYENDPRVMSGIYVYSIIEKRAKLLTRPDQGNVFAPRWSPDGKEIAFALVKAGKAGIGIVGSNGDGFAMLTGEAENVDDRDPTWSPDRRTILFLRNGRLHELDVAIRQVKAVNNELSLNRILGVLTKAQSTLVFCEGPNLSVPDTHELYLVELDNQHRAISVTQLANDNRFYALVQMAPNGERLVFTSDDSLFIRSKDQPAGEPIFSDTYRYRDPSWSSDGSRIVFVTDRP